MRLMEAVCGAKYWRDISNATGELTSRLVRIYTYFITQINKKELEYYNTTGTSGRCTYRNRSHGTHYGISSGSYGNAACSYFGTIFGISFHNGCNLRQHRHCGQSRRATRTSIAFLRTTRDTTSHVPVVS